MSPPAKNAINAPAQKSFCRVNLPGVEAGMIACVGCIAVASRAATATAGKKGVVLVAGVPALVDAIVDSFTRVTVAPAFSGSSSPRSGADVFVWAATGALDSEDGFEAED